MKYEVLKAYAAKVDNEPYTLTAGSVVDLTDDFAAWLNRDSPGTVKPFEPPKPKPKARATITAAKNRMVTDSEDR